MVYVVLAEVQEDVQCADSGFVLAYACQNLIPLVTVGSAHLRPYSLIHTLVRIRE